MKNKQRIIIVFAIAFGMFATAQSGRTSNFNLEKKLAIQGYDPVAYFKQKKTIKGNNSIVAGHDGANYNFVSAANKEVFLKNPDAYEPQYGGWCAYAIGSSGEKVDIDPETFKIIDNKLYLFYNAYFSNTLKSWNKDEVGLKRKADSNWKKIN